MGDLHFLNANCLRNILCKHFWGLFRTSSSTGFLFRAQGYIRLRSLKRNWAAKLVDGASSHIDEAASEVAVYWQRGFPAFRVGRDSGKRESLLNAEVGGWHTYHSTVRSFSDAIFCDQAVTWERLPRFRNSGQNQTTLWVEVSRPSPSCCSRLHVGNCICLRKLCTFRCIFWPWLTMPSSNARASDSPPLKYRHLRSEARLGRPMGFTPRHSKMFIFVENNLFLSTYWNRVG